MGQEFDEYLAYTVFLCVSDGQPSLKSTSEIQPRWNLRMNGWPNVPSPQQAAVAKQWIRREFDVICERCGIKATPILGIEIERLDSTHSGRTPADVVSALTFPLLPRVLRAPNCSVNQEEIRHLLSFFGTDGVKHGGYSVPGVSPTSKDAIVERAIRSLYDWRATLLFLSELKLVSNDTLLMDVPEGALVDSFNIHITRGRQPNFIHKMVCHLAGPARIRLILTTNFDTLIEQAYSDVREPLVPIPVSSKGSLPDPAIVHAQNTIVKLHGNLSETRADFSLDESPSLDNKRAFFHYIQGTYPDDLAGPCFLPGTLLVCGYSGSDNRCVEMIKYLLDANPEARIFWVCHSIWDSQRIMRIFAESSYAHRVRLTVTERCDLLLYEVYQKLCLSLPKGGSTYQYTQNIPPDVSRITQESPNARCIAIETIAESHGWFKPPRLDAVTDSRPLLLADGGPGVLAVLRNIASLLTSQHRMSLLWIELEDCSDTYCVAFELLQNLAIKVGVFQLTPADLVPLELITRCRSIHTSGGAGNPAVQCDDDLTKLWIEHLRLLFKTLFQIVPSKWVVVLYGRNGPGGCAGWTENKFWGTVDGNSDEYGTITEAGMFAPFVKALCSLGFCVAYAPYSEKRKERDARKESLLQTILSEHLEREVILAAGNAANALPPVHTKEIIEKWFSGVPNGPGLQYFSHSLTVSVDSPEVIDYERCMSRMCESWVMRSATRNVHGASTSTNQPYLGNLRFLYAATLFRQSRHYTAFLNEALMPCASRFNVSGKDNDWERDKLSRARLDQLAVLGLFYQKPGAFAWAYRDFRMGVRVMIESLPADYLSGHASIQPLGAWRASYHYWIADWYLRAYHTSGHATPLMEAVFHLFQTIIFAPQFNGTKGAGTMVWRRYRLWRAAMCDLVKALRIGRTSIRLWLGAAEFDVWFGRNWSGTADAIYSAKTALLEPLLKEQGLDVHADNLIETLFEEIRQLAIHGKGQDSLKLRIPNIVSNASPIGDWLRESRPATDAVEGDRLDFWNTVKVPSPITELCNKTFHHFVDTQSVGDGRLETIVGSWRQTQLEASSGDNYLYYLVQLLNGWAFAVLIRAKLEQQIRLNNIEDGTAHGETLGLDPEVKKLWLLVTVLASSALELCRVIGPTLDMAEQEERVRGLSLYSVGLARLGRFFESHRRLNEAHALLTKLEKSDSRVLSGIIELRRAEAHLLEALVLGALKSGVQPLDTTQWYERYESAVSDTDKAGERLSRLNIAKLDDCWCALESAEILFTEGKLHSPRWWARLCVLKLRCLMENPGLNEGNDGARRILQFAERIRRDKFDRLIGLFNSGTPSAMGHPALRLRLGDYALRLGRRLSPGDSGYARNLRIRKCGSIVDIVSDFNKMTEGRTPLLLLYAKQIEEFKVRHY